MRLYFTKLGQILLFFTSFIVLADDISQIKNEDIHNRISRIETKIDNIVKFDYDPFIRDKISSYIALQETNRDSLIRLQSKIDSIEKSLRSPNSEFKELNDKVNHDVELIKADLYRILNSTKDLHQQQLNSILAVSNSSLSGALKSAQDADTRTSNIFSILSITGTILAIGATLGAVYLSLFLKNISTTVGKAERVKEDLDESYKELTKKVNNEIIELRLLRKEILLLHKLIDLKSNYSLYKQRFSQKGKSTDNVKKQINDKLLPLLSGYEKLKIRWEKVKDQRTIDYENFIQEIDNNLSYCNAIQGMIFYREGEHKKAYSSFVIAQEFNSSMSTDRIYNLGCLASIMYKKYKEQHYLDITIKCYIDLSLYKGELIIFLDDRDVIPIVSDIHDELKKRKLENLIMPILSK